MKKVRDHYFHQARKDGFAARSVYKLEEMDKKHRLLKKGQRVLDLGCAPGSWTQYAAARVGESGLVVGVDLQAVDIAPGPGVRLLRADAFTLDPLSLLVDGQPFDVLLSDMAPKTTGIKSADALRSVELVLHALELARTVLRPGGTFVAKVFQGAQLPQLRKTLAGEFQKVSVVKPKATRSESVEVFLLGVGKNKTPLP